MVDPRARRRGIGTALLQAAVEVLAGRGRETALLVTPRATPAGAAFAAAMGGTLSHSEHFLVLGRAPDPSGRHPELVIRDAVDDDVPAMRRILAAAFGEEENDEVLRRLMREPQTRQLVVERGDVLVGCLRLAGDLTATGVYGFAVSPELQGQGIGRAVLEQVCAELRSAGVRDVTIEVEVDNDGALGLYTAVGFEPRATEDYFRVDLDRLQP
jgi:ribosomal protein S18 acetylase RimI-like enzyme